MSSLAGINFIPRPQARQVPIAMPVYLRVTGLCRSRGPCLLGVELGHFRLPPDFPALTLPLHREPARQSCLKIDLFSGDGVVEIQKLGVQEISSIAGEAG